MEKSLLIAVGGNSLIRPGQRGTIAEQFANARRTAESIAGLVERGYRIIITHGNGPQVGSQLLRSEFASSQAYQLPLDVCVAMTQGEIGYVLQNTLRSALDARNLKIPVVSLITTVLVDKHDEAFEQPSKPVGPFYTKDTAEQRRTTDGWNIVEDAARGYRRVVPSPRPLCVAELDVLRICLANNIITIAAGGGGIPTVRENGMMHGVEAVIDKDRVSALIAAQLHIERWLISTDVDHVYLDYKKPTQRPIMKMNAAMAKLYLEAGHFAEGSMKPKIEGAIEYLAAGGNEVVITSPEHLVDALDGATGTHIVP
jgi:carbamate kinase